MMRVGIDLGGSHIGIGVVNKEGKIVQKIEKRLMGEEKKDIKGNVEPYIIQIVNELFETYKIERIGMAVPRNNLWW